MLCRSAAEILFLPIPEYLQKAKIADYRSKGGIWDKFRPIYSYHLKKSV
jgi:hypothetical protein